MNYVEPSAMKEMACAPIEWVPVRETASRIFDD